MTTSIPPAPQPPGGPHPGPGPKPGGPTHPTPVGPPQRAADDVFALAASLGEDVAPMPPARGVQSPTGAGAIATARGPGTFVPGEVPGCKGRGGGAVAAATFSLPLTPPLPSFDGHLPPSERLFPGASTGGDDRPTPGKPGRPKPTPFPPPPKAGAR